MAIGLKGCCVKPSTILISSFHRVSIFCIRVSRKISIWMPGCLGPYIRMDNKRYFLFWYNHVGRLYIVKITGHVLWVLVLPLNGFIPSILNTNRSFLSPFLRLSESYHRISSTSFWLVKKRLRRPTTARYHITMAGILLYFLEMPKVVSARSTEATLFIAPFLFLLFPSAGPWLLPLQ
jgi:hypothetical protein